MKSALHYFLCGLGMGAADVVPGVSGGTVAFILGIYEQLLNAVKSINTAFLRELFSLRFQKAFARIPWKFLTPLLCGIIFSIFSLARLTLHILHTYPEALWSFFFGLIISSILILMKDQNMTIKNLAVMSAGAIAAWILAGMEAIALSHDLPHIFMAGFIALCAMILPGISGSFMLVIMGQYTFLLSALVEFKLDILGVFLAGGICGLMSFSRVLSLCFRRFPSETNALLIGIMAGCLRTVWPWHKGTLPSLPSVMNDMVMLAAVICAAGIALPFFIYTLANRKNDI